MEIVPPITLADFKTIKFERLTAPVTDAEVDKSLQTLAEQNRPFAAKDDGAENGDRVTVSFQGTDDGKPFEGGSGEDVPIVLGSGQFIPGFEDQLIGIKAGESRTFDCEIPGNYLPRRARRQRRDLRGHGQGRRSAGHGHARRRFRQDAGLESLDEAARSASASAPQREHAAASRQKLKRALLDQLDEQSQIRAAADAGRRGIQQRLGDHRERSQGAGPHFADEGTTEEKARAEYRGIAERRVRLGLVLAEIGEKNNIKVTTIS